MKKFILIVLLGVFVLPNSASGKEVIKNVRVKDGRNKYYFIMFQSEVEPSLWYCGQSKPQVLMRQSDTGEIPEISLIRFQRKDIKNPEKLNEGAFFRMHLSLGPGEEAFEALIKKAQGKSMGKTVRLSAVPFPAIRLELQKPDGTKVEMKAETLAGFSNQQSSQHVGFSVILDTLQTDILDALLRGNTGAKYQLYYNLQYSDPLLSGQTSPSTIQQRDLEQKDPGFPGSGRNLPGSRNFDQINREAASKEGWELAGEGFIGFGQYSKEIQEKCIFVEKNLEQWSNSYLTLPVIQSPKDLSIDRIELEVILVHQKKKFGKMNLTWTPKKGWRDSYGAPLVYAVFDLTEVKKQVKDLHQIQYLLKQKIVSNKTDVLTQEFFQELLVGGAPVSDPLDLADVFELQTGFLNWSESAEMGLQRIEIKLSEGSWKSERTIRPVKQSGKLVVPDINQWLVKRSLYSDQDEFIAEVFFVKVENGLEKRIPWNMNGKNLREELPSMSCIFFDQDWEK